MYQEGRTNSLVTDLAVRDRERGIRVDSEIRGLGNLKQ